MPKDRYFDVLNSFVLVGDDSEICKGVHRSRSAPKWIQAAQVLHLVEAATVEHEAIRYVAGGNSYYPHQIESLVETGDLEELDGWGIAEYHKSRSFAFTMALVIGVLCPIAWGICITPLGQATLGRGSPSMLDLVGIGALIAFGIACGYWGPALMREKRPPVTKSEAAAEAAE